MPPTHARIDPTQIAARPLAERQDRVDIRSAAIDPATSPDAAPAALGEGLQRLAEAIVAARTRDASVMLTYGAHVIKNGCGPLLRELLASGWVTHLATQGSGLIHDWEFAHRGTSSEAVEQNVHRGRFGTWDETGRALIAAAMIGAESDCGWGEALGRVISEDAATHPYCHYSVTAAAYASGVPLCVLPGIGYDIYCCHPMFTEEAGAAIGRCATRDFHTFAHGVERLTGGVYLSVGSAIMSPMVFEKAMSIANNLRLGRGERPIADHHVAVVDIQDGGGWDWFQDGEPPEDHPAYYLRFCKSFHRMGGRMDYLQADNRLALHHLATLLRGRRPTP